MESLFIALTRAVEGTPLLALAAALAWGLASVLLSPCHLATIPLVVGFVGEQAALTAARALRLAAAFAAGVLVTIGLVGVVTAALGRILGDVGPAGNYVVAAVLLVVGLHLVGVIPFPWSAPGPAQTSRRGVLAGFLLGLLYGLALGPCTFAFMAPLLAVALRVAGQAPMYAAALLLTFGLGHALVILVAGTSVGLVQQYLRWSEKSRAVTTLRAVCGVLVILGGLYMLYTAR